MERGCRHRDRIASRTASACAGRRGVVEADVRSPAFAPAAWRGGHRERRVRAAPATNARRCRAGCWAKSIESGAGASTRSSQACSCSRRARWPRARIRVGPVDGQASSIRRSGIVAAGTWASSCRADAPPLRFPPPSGRGKQQKRTRQAQAHGQGQLRLIASAPAGAAESGHFDCEVGQRAAVEWGATVTSAMRMVQAESASRYGAASHKRSSPRRSRAEGGGAAEARRRGGSHQRGRSPSDDSVAGHARAAAA